MESGVRLCPTSDLSAHPRCPHGPTLLFSRADKQFYACSAYRDRKHCAFYQEAGQVVGAGRVGRVVLAARQLVEEGDCRPGYTAVRLVLAKEAAGLEWCRDCSRPAKPACQATSHARCTVDRTVLQAPSRLLAPRNQDKKEAQYFFSPASRQLLLGVVEAEQFSHVLCIGCPSLFECLPARLQDGHSLLLDIDPRFGNFYNELRFQWYNFFNGHFFYGASGQAVLREFLTKADRLLVLLDPPFGTKTEVMISALDRLADEHHSWNLAGELRTLLVLPYFMERQLTALAPRLCMADYRLTYTG